MIMSDFKETLYKATSNGKPVEWTIEVEGGAYRTHDGYVGGAITTSAWTHCKPKNVGKSNETTAEYQALLEAQAKAVKKREKGYTDKLEDVQQAKAAAWLEPMLAFDIAKKPKAIKSGDDIAIQPKLDGMRCIITKEGMFSRNGKPVTSCPHIFVAAHPILQDLPDGARLDGELYHHQFRQDFNSLISLIRKSEPLREHFHELVQFHIYDIDLPRHTYQMRHALLQKIDDRQLISIRVVPTEFYTVTNPDLAQTYFRDAEVKAVEEGYEGAMVRIVMRDYENKRSDSLLKVKSFQDEEFDIVEVLEGEGNRGNMAGKILVRLKDGQTCEAGIAGGVPYYLWLWKERDRLIGKKATVKFFNYTPDGKLRFPVVKAVDRQDIN